VPYNFVNEISRYKVNGSVTDDILNMNPFNQDELAKIAKYFKQIKFTFSQEYIITALTKNTHITQNLVKLFHTRFSC
jgi:NAD-specific glutamate dehydrogenase